MATLQYDTAVLQMIDGVLHIFCGPGFSCRPAVQERIEEFELLELPGGMIQITGEKVYFEYISHYYFHKPEDLDESLFDDMGSPIGIRQRKRHGWFGKLEDEKYVREGWFRLKKRDRVNRMLYDVPVVVIKDEAIVYSNKKRYSGKLVSEDRD